MRNALSSRSILFAFVLLAFLMFATPVVSSAAIVFSIGIAPPPLLVYAQPVCPGPGYIWEPGYWAYDDGYFWVPGAWVLIPEAGLFWTPGYWGWNGSLYVFNQGYWGPSVGFYGGINYGFGYTGVGYQGGYWNHGTFFYNRSVNNVGNVRNVYNRTVTVSNTNRVSYNGPGGITARPTATEQAAARARHIAPTSAQVAHMQAASRNRQSYASANHGKPPVAATAKPGHSGRGAVTARAAAPSYKPPVAGHAERVAPNHAAVRSSSPHTARAVTPHAANAKPQRQANARPQVQPRPQPRQAQSHARQANGRPQAEPRQVRSQPRMAQQRPNPVSRPPVAQQHRLPQTQQRTAHAAAPPRPHVQQPRPAPATRQAAPAREKKS